IFAIVQFGGFFENAGALPVDVIGTPLQVRKLLALQLETMGLGFQISLELFNLVMTGPQSMFISVEFLDLRAELILTACEFFLLSLERSLAGGKFVGIFLVFSRRLLGLSLDRCFAGADFV